MAFMPTVDDEIRDAVNLFNTNWNATEGLDVTARLMAWSDSITKLHNKGAIIDGESVLVGSMNWGSNAALRNREMGVLIHDKNLPLSICNHSMRIGIVLTQIQIQMEIYYRICGRFNTV